MAVLLHWRKDSDFTLMTRHYTKENIYEDFGVRLGQHSQIILLYVQYLHNILYSTCNYLLKEKNIFSTQILSFCWIGEGLKSCESVVNMNAIMVHNNNSLSSFGKMILDNSTLYIKLGDWWTLFLGIVRMRLELY